MDRQSHLERCASKLHHLQLHPALSEYLDLGPDIYEKLVSWIFTFEPFAYWQRSEKNWELRCSGSPGSGKTTFVALAARQLRSKYPSKGSAVASIFIVRDVRWSEATFIEDLLGSIFRQLKAGHTCEGECEVNTALLEYVEACKGHQRGATRIRLIRRALDLCVASLDHAFLVLDGIDRCSPAVELFLEDEFPRLRASGLRILTTSRIPCLRMPARNYNCDTHDCPEPDERLVYWLCQEPECKKLKIVVCVACKEKNVSCKNCGGHNFQQPYEHVDIQIMPGGQNMIDFITQSLEQEHGDLGLGASETGSKPPPSRLGAALAEGDNAGKLVARLYEQASYSIAIARARLDIVDAAPSLEVAFEVGDRLPASITAVFEAGIQAIMAQSQDQRDLGLRAIAAVAYVEKQDSVSGQYQYEPHGGVPFTVLDKWLREAASLGSARAFGLLHVPHRSLEEVLHATKGFLIVLQDRDEAFVKSYHDDFSIWVSEGYNEALVSAASQVQFGRLADVKQLNRVQTFAARTLRDRKDDQRRKWLQPLGEENSDAKDLVVADTRRPKLQGRENVRSDILDKRPGFKLSRTTTTWIN